MLSDTNYEVHDKRPRAGLWWASASPISEGLALGPLPNPRMPGGYKSLPHMPSGYLKRSQESWGRIEKREPRK